jgi:hypothetical protein
MKSFLEYAVSMIAAKAKVLLVKTILHDRQLGNSDDSKSEFFVWRIGSNSESDLNNRNAGDLLGIAKFFGSDNAEFGQTGDHVFLYRVSNQTKKFGPYQLFRRNSSESSGTMIGRKLEPIKWGIGVDHVRWYSFPANGDWSAKLVKKVPLSICEARAKEFGTYVGADEPMDAVLFYEAATNKKLL